MPHVRTLLAVALILTAACSSSPTPAPPPDDVTGLITSIARDDRGSITGFTVEDGGTRHEIRIDPRRDYGFDLEHLDEHRMQELPVRVTLEERDAGLFAVEIQDA